MRVARRAARSSSRPSASATIGMTARAKPEPTKIVRKRNVTAIVAPARASAP